MGLLCIYYTCPADENWHQKTDFPDPDPPIIIYFLLLSALKTGYYRDNLGSSPYKQCNFLFNFLIDNQRVITDP